MQESSHKINTLNGGRIMAVMSLVSKYIVHFSWENLLHSIKGL
ncbi:hypothetical protein [Avibacterium paragallinarum]|nr:hypothetical protein [Avibacterium paragallinarum]